MQLYNLFLYTMEHTRPSILIVEQSTSWKITPNSPCSITGDLYLGVKKGVLPLLFGRTLGLLPEVWFGGTDYWSVNSHSHWKWLAFQGEGYWCASASQYVARRSHVINWAAVACMATLQFDKTCRMLPRHKTKANKYRNFQIATQTHALKKWPASIGLKAPFCSILLHTVCLNLQIATRILNITTLRKNNNDKRPSKVYGTYNISMRMMFPFVAKRVPFLQLFTESMLCLKKVINKKKKTHWSSVGRTNFQNNYSHALVMHHLL